MTDRLDVAQQMTHDCPSICWRHALHAMTLWRTGSNPLTVTAVLQLHGLRCGPGPRGAPGGKCDDSRWGGTPAQRAAAGSAQQLRAAHGQVLRPLGGALTGQQDFRP